MGNQSIISIEAVIDYIESHLDGKLELETVAEAVHYSKYHLHRLFTETVGMTIHDYVQRRQLTEAAKLLVFSDLDTMAANFNDLENISNTLLLIVTGASFVILFLIFIFWIKNRTNEIGILLSLGIAKGKIFMQILTEAILIGVLALSLSFLIAPAVSDAAADYLVGQQVEQAELQDEMNAGKVSTDYRPPELTVMNVETEITTNMLLIDSLSVGLLILFSTCAASVLIFRKKPKDILSEMS